MGDYRGAIAHIRSAISLNVSETDDSIKRDKLYGRLAKCFLHLLDFRSAENAMSSIDNSHLRTELYESVESMKALWVEIPDESVLRRQVLDQVPRYKPCLQDVPEYYCVGHDQVEPLTEPLGMTGTGRPHISFFFAGSGDGRNLFSAITTMACREAEMRRPCFRKLHFTVLDLKPAALARVLIFFNMMVRVDTKISEEVPNATDYFLAMAYIFSCQVIPPFVEAKLQRNIRELIKRLEGEDAALQFIYVREHDREPLIRVLRQWQQPWDGISKVADARKFIKQKHWEGGLRTASYFGQCLEHGPRSERNDFDRFTTLLPPAVVANRREPSLVDPLAEYRSTGKSKKLLQHIDSNWRINNTLIDYDFADRSREQGDERSLPLEFHPLEVVESMGLLEPTQKANTSSIEQLADVFRAFSISTLTLSIQKRLVVELIVGEMADIMERIRYNLLDYRLSPPNASGTLDPTDFPQTFDYVHMSNIPDYIGGHLTSFLAGRPLLKEDRPSSLRFSNLLNPPEFEDHQAFQSEYLLMYDMERIRRHFLVTRRPGEVTKEDLPPTLGTLRHPFAFEGYMTWDRVSSSAMSFKELLPKPEFEKWVYGHFLKICLPYPRPIFSGQPVYAPLNLTAVIRLVIGMFEVGYPAHWLLRIFSCICSGVITTCARPPTNRVCNAADIDATHLAKEISVQPWVAEFTTLLSIWRRLLPFGIDSLSGTLVPLGTIFQYSITFPPFPAKHERVPHFILVFWNTEVGYTTKPPVSIYNLLLDVGGGDSHVSARDIREKGIVCVTAFHYTTASRTAVFWMRADKMEQMIAGKWRAFIWRTDAWKAVTDGVDVSSGISMGKKWTMLF
ncbi:hypothetical protein HIM_10759 [Hirsutella minnesotensis 3608]|uniref:DUF4470 domain-containing protein n=1 Tax=Hirsutella minnesotensis 3608 TaxID=1043627 RepID=A0A0F8A1Y7_9HYPO|nr:hypothetical protein HIM_10759 [Hirsutella minnesotensis 3608]